MYKYELMRLLDDDDVRRKIFNIVNAPPAEPEESADEPTTVEADKQIPDEPPIDSDKKNSAEHQIESLRG